MKTVIYLKPHRLIMLDEPDRARILRRVEQFDPGQYFNPNCCGLCAVALREGADFTWDATGMLRAAGPRSHDDEEAQTCNE